MKGFEAPVAPSTETEEVGSEWEPEERKEWPLFIRERFEALNAAHDLDLDKLKELFSQDGSLEYPSLLAYLSRRFKEDEQRDPEVGREIGEMINSLAEDKDGEVRAVAAEALGNLGEPAVEKLKTLQVDGDQKVREAAAVSIVAAEPSLENLKSLAKSKDPQVRITAIEALGKMGQPAMEELIILVENEEDYGTVEAAISALGNIGEPAQAALENIVKTEKDYNMKSAAISALGQVGPSALGALSAMAMDKDYDLRSTATRALGSLGWSAREMIETLTEDEDSIVRREAINGLINIGPAALDKVRPFAKSQDEGTREAVASALGKMGQPALEDLNVLAEDESAKVRAAAAMSLSMAGGGALGSLVLLAEDENYYVRLAAAQALGSMGEPAFETLKDLVKDERGVELYALTSMAKIRIDSLSPEERERMIKSFIVRQEPLLANPLFEEIYNPDRADESPLLKMADIVESLRQAHPGLIGLSVLGSFSKGYWMRISDFDWGLVFEDIPPGEREALTNEFREKAKEADFKLCYDHSLDLSSIADASPQKLEIIFNGLFLGDRQRLREAQREVIGSISSTKWREVQKEWSGALENYKKMIARFNFTPDEVQQIQDLREFLWHPPDYEMARQEYGAD